VFKYFTDTIVDLSGTFEVLIGTNLLADILGLAYRLDVLVVNLGR
jgi:hypothetical protein